MSTPLTADWYHNEKPKIGLLVLNLGTPDAPTPRAVRRYLREFLIDRRVIDLPRWKWLPILYLFVLPFRPKKSAALYQKIWTAEGSPLLRITERQARLLKEEVERQLGETIEVEIGMRYGNPSVRHALQQLRLRAVQKVLVLPLYPQYSATTTGATFDGVVDVLKTWRYVPELRMISQFHDHPGYIRGLAESIRELWDRDGKPQKLLFSFHGIPMRYFLAGDPYYCHCQKTARLVSENLGLAKESYIVSFQSLFGKEEWLRPYTEQTVKELARSGVQSLDVICPGFASDCLETLEEIDGLNREFFLKNGGKQFRYIPCLNDRPDFIETLAEIVTENLGGWVQRGDRIEATAG